MLHSLNDLKRFSLDATDGTLGSVHDLYFEDVDWTVRYLVANSGFWFFGREVLLNVGTLGKPNLERDTIPVSMTRKQIKEAPSSSSDKPVSEQMNGGELPPFLSAPESMPIPAFFPLTGFAPLATSSAGTAEAAVRRAEIARADPHLRSANEIEGYHIAAADGDVGKVRDVIVDREQWRIRYLSVDTGGWLSGHEVVLSVDWIDAIDWHERSLTVPVRKKAIEDSPPLASLADLERSYEERLYQSYGYPAYWI